MKLQAPSRWAWRAAALLALGVVFMSYLQPDLVMQLATQLWNCF
jgi:hypothetical protein